MLFCTNAATQGPSWRFNHLANQNSPFMSRGLNVVLRRRGHPGVQLEPGERQQRPQLSSRHPFSCHYVHLALDHSFLTINPFTLFIMICFPSPPAPFFHKNNFKESRNICLFFTCEKCKKFSILYMY
jgi:hypothetical protein